MINLWPLLLGAFLGLAPTVSSSTARDDVRAADAAFAARAAEVGQQAAFIEYLAADAILFRPEAVPGQEWLATHEPAPGRLSWRPSAAASACTGRLGITSGPWSYSNDEGGQAVEGHYLSIWRLGDDAQWRVVLDHGIDHAPGAEPAVPLQTAFEHSWPAAAAGKCTGRGNARDLARAEQDLNSQITRLGLQDALRRAAAEEAVAYRDDAAPGQLAAALPASDATYGPGTIARSVGTVFDPDADLAVTHGVLQSTEVAPGAVYVRVWSRERRHWRLAIDLQTPLPAP